MSQYYEYFYKFFRPSPTRKAFADSRVGVWNWNIHADVFNVNRFWYDILGYSRNKTRKLELIFPLIHPDDLTGFKDSLNRMLSSASNYEIDYELRLKKNDGSWLWIYVNGKIIKFRKGAPFKAEGIILDIERQKRIEIELQNKNSEIEALYEESEAQNEEMAAMMDELHRNQLELEEANTRLIISESKFRDIVEKSPIGIIQSTLEGRIISVNRAFCKTFGYDSPEELMKDVRDTHDFYNNRVTRDWIVERSEKEKFVFTQDVTGNKKNGDTVYVNVYLIRLKDKFSGEDYLTTFVEDITELRLSQFERDLFFNNSGDLILISTVDGEIKQLNPAWKDIFGWDIDELKKVNLTTLIHPDDSQKVIDFRRRLSETGERLPLTARYRDKSGEYRIIRWVSIYFIETGLIFSSGRDETERYEAEMELQKMWDRLEIALQSGSIGLWDFNVKENSLSTNSNMAEIIGHSRIDNIDIRWRDFVHEDDLKSSTRAMIDLVKGIKNTYITEHRLKLSDGTYRWFFSRGKIVEYDPDGKPLRIAGSITDITEQKEAETRRLALEYQMLQAQKLESLGLLAGGIAHDFNNLLTGILGNADMLLYELPDNFPTQQKLIDIRKASKRASELTKQMLAYTGRNTFTIEVIDLNALIEEMSSLLDISVSKKVRIIYSLFDNLPCITGDPTQISQILMNLILNASEAIENNGEIRITTLERECGTDEIDSLNINNNIQPGNFVLLEVSDNGCGISQDRIKQIFDPFFTTKFTGRGLGLAAVSGIIRSHNAGLHVESRLNEGTTFRIYFSSTEQHPAGVCLEEKPPVDLKKKNITVLVADDESYIRNLTSRMLKTAGFDVLLAENGIDAIEIYRNNRSSIGCVILDLTMPEMDGHEALLALRKTEDSIPIIISSGYSELDINTQFEGENISGFLQKPYQFEDLLAVIDKAINHSRED